MSMTMLTFLQLTEIFLVYSVMTVLVPAVIFRQKVSGQRLTVRFMTYFTIGNFYIINLVFFLQLLHISYGYTLWLMTLVPAAAAWIRLNHVPIRAVLWKKYDHIHKLLLRQLGLRTFLRMVWSWLQEKGRLFAALVRKDTQFHRVEWLLLTGLVGYLLWIYGANAFTTYGYCLSDVPVHNYWINAMGQNHIFVAGVYPFGFHCIIYYLHAAFGMDTYVLLRLFCVVQTFYAHMILFAFLKAVCKTQFAPLVGLGIFVLLPICSFDSISRFYSSLPQEFGMIFILPSIYFALAFFEAHKRECDSVWKVSKEKKKLQQQERKKYLRTLPRNERLRMRLQSVPLSTWYLMGYAMNFSMTLAVHFYATIIAGIFCGTIALAYFWRFFHWRYFWRVIVACMLGVSIAILPMAAAYASGTPLQASLNWGMSVVRGQDIATDDAPKNEPQAPAPDTTPPTPPTVAQRTEASLSDAVVTLDDWMRNHVQSVATLLIRRARFTYYSVNPIVETYVVHTKNGGFLKYHLLLLAWLLGFALLALLQRRFDYGMMLVASGLYLLLLFILLGSKVLGLPELMDYNRCREFLAYSLPILWSLSVDAPIYAVFGHCKQNWVMYVVSLLACCVLAGSAYMYVPLRKPEILVGLETNAAVTCLTNIIHENSDFSWTIVSANDELNMGKDHGYHYESIDFLREMDHAQEKGMVTIPTRYVYFFIEKVPIDYDTEYENSGQAVSVQGAAQELPQGGGLAIYAGENRWIVMSKLYYWAQAYQKMYSHEMKVYYEDNTFICYQITQNTYDLNNFAIDDTYNR